MTDAVDAVADAATDPAPGALRRLQPLLHDLVAVLAAPTQAWAGQGGQVRGADGVQGVYHSDVRVLREAVLTLAGHEPEPVAVVPRGAGEVTHVALARHLGDEVPDPTVRVERTRCVEPGVVLERVVVRSTASGPVEGDLAVDVSVDLAPVERVKAGESPEVLPPSGVHPDGAAWSDGAVTARLRAPGARVDVEGARVRLVWPLSVAPGDRAEVAWSVEASDAEAVVGPAPAGARTGWEDVRTTADDRRLAPLVERGLADLAALRMTTADQPDEVFLAAGAPWFFTLFGRDSLWAARLLLPFGTGLAASTLRVLAARQGVRVDHGTAEEPGKVLHEVRRGTFAVDDSGRGIELPPVYYGTVDATPLWVCLLHDAWRWGMPPEQVEALLPAAEAALGWMVADGDADGDGFLEYVDRSGRGLANQGWKDSGDSVQWRRGGLAEGPIALCEVQGYAHEAALAGAALLDAFDRPGGDRWREWAARLADRFRASFWVDDAHGPHPAIALDGGKQPVDSLTSNIGHLLGTGLLSADEEDLVASRVTAEDMDSGFGLRTMSTTAAGFAPLSYHGGSVWPHDTAIVVAGLARSGRAAQAAGLVEGLLAAGAAFDSRLPELYGGDARREVPRPVPYPAACRPQAWSAAAGAAVATSVLGLRPDAPARRLAVVPATPSPVGALRVEGLRLGGEPLSVALDASGSVVDVSAPPGVQVST